MIEMPVLGCALFLEGLGSPVIGFYRALQKNNGGISI